MQRAVTLERSARRMHVKRNSSRRQGVTGTGTPDLHLHNPLATHKTPPQPPRHKATPIRDTGNTSTCGREQASPDEGSRAFMKMLTCRRVRKLSGAEPTAFVMRFVSCSAAYLQQHGRAIFKIYSCDAHICSNMQVHSHQLACCRDEICWLFSHIHAGACMHVCNSACESEGERVKAMHVVVHCCSCHLIGTYKRTKI
eukprot:1161724-Pelagomonas_calceolata.AAC.6